MYRFFVAPENIYDNYIEIHGDDVNHMKNVLRMNVGESFVASCGRGEDYYCSVKGFGDHVIIANVDRKEEVHTELPVKLVLFQGLPKADKMELIIQKAVELGASEIVPVRTKRAVVKLDEKKAAKKLQRWQTIAEAAAKQSGRGFVPEVHEVLSFSEALRYAGELECSMIPYELCEDMKGTSEVIEKACEKSSVGIFIGPEGGFERGEVEQAMEQGTVPISLGKRILRTETAGLAILSVLMFRIEERNGD